MANLTALIFSHFLLVVSLVLIYISFAFSMMHFADGLARSAASFVLRQIWRARHVLDDGFLVPDGHFGLWAVIVELAKAHLFLFIAELQFLLVQCFIAPVSFFARNLVIEPGRIVYGWFKLVFTACYGYLKLAVSALFRLYGRIYALVRELAQDVVSSILHFLHIAFYGPLKKLTGYVASKFTEFYGRASAYVGSTISHYLFEAIERLETLVDDFCRAIKEYFWAAVEMAKGPLCTFGEACWAHMDENYKKRVSEDFSDFQMRLYEIYYKKLNATSFKYRQLISYVYSGWMSILFEAVQQGFLANAGDVSEYTRYIIRSNPAQLGAFLRLTIEGTCNLFNLLRGHMCSAFSKIGIVIDFGRRLIISTLNELVSLAELAAFALGNLMTSLRTELNYYGRELLSSTGHQFGALYEYGWDFLNSRHQKIGAQLNLTRQAICKFFGGEEEASVKEEENVKKEELKSPEEVRKEIREKMRDLLDYSFRRLQREH